MPRDRKTPQEIRQIEGANRRAQWLASFAAELVRLNPGLAGAGKHLQRIGIGELAHAGIESDPAAAARAYHAASAKAAKAAT